MLLYDEYEVVVAGVVVAGGGVDAGVVVLLVEFAALWTFPLIPTDVVLVMLGVEDEFVIAVDVVELLGEGAVPFRWAGGAVLFPGLGIVAEELLYIGPLIEAIANPAEANSTITKAAR